MQLQIRYIGESPDRDTQFQVVRDGKHSPTVALPSPWDIPIDAQDATFREELHWYLEEYLTLAHGPYHTRAEKVLASLYQWGQECFTLLFDSGGHALK